MVAAFMHALEKSAQVIEPFSECSEASRYSAVIVGSCCLDGSEHERQDRASRASIATETK